MSRIKVAFLALALCVAPALRAFAAGPAVVQAAFASGQHAGSCEANGAMTLPSPPTPGNLIITWFWRSSISVSENTADWTVYFYSGNVSGGDTILSVMYRYVQSGDTAALPGVCSTGNPFWASNAVEVSGVSGVIGTDIEQTDTINPGPSALSLTTTSIMTAHANDLVLIGVVSYDAPSGNITGASGFTFDVQQINASDWGAWAQVSKSIPGNGTAVSTTFTIPSTAGPCAYYTVVMRPSSSPPVGRILFHSFP